MSNKLYVIPGHGANDVGAIGHGYQEAVCVRNLATLLKKYGGDAVVLTDFNLNSYRSNVIKTIPKGSVVLELHLDSFTKPTAKGGHIIIPKARVDNEYDNALADMLKAYFPGRADMIVGRTDLANVKRSIEYGVDYRLMECCFISNADDIKKFNTTIDAFAKEILKCFGIVIEADAPVKTVTDIAREVLAGKWGNGSKRKTNLTKAGYDYNAVQAEVNKLVKGTSTVATAPAKKSNEDIAREVIAGKWGNGSTRKKKLKAAGYDPAVIQAIVNKLLK